MTTIKNEHGNKGTIDYHADVPMTVAPKIKAERIIDNIRYYFVDGGKQWIADTYDYYFKPPKMKMKGKFHKGDLIGNAAIWE